MARILVVTSGEIPWLACRDRGAAIMTVRPAWPVPCRATPLPGRSWIVTTDLLACRFLPTGWPSGVRSLFARRSPVSRRAPPSGSCPWRSPAAGASLAQAPPGQPGENRGERHLHRHVEEPDVRTVLPQRIGRVARRRRRDLIQVRG